MMMAWLNFELPWSWFTLSLIIMTVILWLNSWQASSRRQRPPGPPGWPLVGNIFDVSRIPHQDMHELKSRYGPLIWLRLGTKNAIVVQSAKAAEELFRKHDVHFASRTVHDSMTAGGFNEGAMSESAYGEYWQAMRRLCTVELITQKRIHSSASLRQKCVESMIDWIREKEGGEIQFDECLVRMTFNLISNFLFSRDVIDMKSETTSEFFDAITRYMKEIGKPNLTDAFRFLRWADLQGIRRNSGKHLKRLLKMVDEFVKERIEDRQQGRLAESRDLLDALLEYKGNEGSKILSEKNMKMIILEMFFGGTETTSTTIHWAMTELLKNPNALKTLKAELCNSRPVEEKDLPELPYLQAVIKESMRLHPSLPLLLPRKAIQDTEFLGYLVPKNTTVIVNAWAIHRDPETWEDPLSFRPDRFLNSNINSKGQHFELIPFGSGRRSCVGRVLGDRMVSLTMARLVQAFDWELPGGVGPEKLDMRESVGISLRKLEPLRVIPRRTKG